MLLWLSEYEMPRGAPGMDRMRRDVMEELEKANDFLDRCSWE